MKENSNKIAYWLAVWFGSGLLPKAPGTWGSIVAAIMGGWILKNYDIYIMLIAIIFIFGIGVWAADNHQQATGKHDLGEVVIDEVAGQWITLLPLYFVAVFQTLWMDIFVAFILFRLFDILKPWPISWMDKHIDGGVGVMVDDVAAGIGAAIVFLILGYFI